MNKVLSVVLAVLVLVSFSIPVRADTSKSRGVPESFAPRFTHISMLESRLSISSSGLATCFGRASTYDSSQTVKLTVILQKSTANGWEEVKAWTESGAGVPGVGFERQYYVVSGTYRVCVTARVYSSGGTMLEAVSGYSSWMVY